MLKKNEVIEALKEGGYIYMKGQPLSAYVYSVSDGLLGRCRHDMALRIAELSEYETIPDGDGGTWYRICDPVAVNAEKAAAAHELASIRTPGAITLRAKNDCYIGQNYVAKGRTYVITVYGDGTQEQPGNAYGKLYDFRTREHAVYFEIIERPAEELLAEEAPAAADSSVFPVITPDIQRSFEHAHGSSARADQIPAICGTDGRACRCMGSRADRMPCLSCPLADYAAAIGARRELKHYARADGEAGTRSASEALSWHRAGHDLIVAALGKNAVYVHGAPQKAAREEDENRAHCKHIADELDAYINGDLRRCPDCGEEIRRDWDDVGDAFKCPHCGEISDPDDWEPLSVWDFLGDCYDVEYRCDGSRELRSVCIMVACGGPNIYLDTASKDVELYWWNERARYPMSYAAVEAIDEWAEEIWRCL